MRPLELKVPPVVVVAVSAIGMQGLAWTFPSVTFDLPGSRTVALGLALLGVASALAGVYAFRTSETTVDPRTPDAASVLVVTGVYRVSRNPMYLGFLLVLMGWGIYLSNAASAMFLPAFVGYLDVFQIRPEERVLLSRFGSQFAAYMTSVRRWV